MRAAVVTRYGPPDVVRVVDVPVPAPRAGEVLVRVGAAAVTSGDARIRAARFPPGFAIPARLALGLRGPRRPILGSACAGVVERVGDGVTAVTPGTRVCGMAGLRMGAHAECVALPATAITATPSHVRDDLAAGVLFGGSAALFFLRDKARIGPGMSVLVNGASGAIGTSAVQLARRAGARVTGVTSGRNATLVQDLGATRVVDYTRQAVTALDERFDVVFDTVGNLTAATGRRLVRDGGTLILAVAGLGDLLTARRGVVAGTAPERADDFAHLVQLVADGQLKVVIDAVFPLDDIQEAHRRVDSGRKCGNILVRP
jgi:NADPH:quinone reductase-like Zn-dependent oxidoreductase